MLVFCNLGKAGQPISAPYRVIQSIKTTVEAEEATSKMTFFTCLESWLWLLARSSVGAVSQDLSQRSSIWLGWALHFTQHGSPMPPPPECKSRSYYFFLRHTVGKESDCNTGDPSSIPGWRWSLEKGMATHSSIPAWRIPWTEEPGQLQSTESQRVRHNRATNTHTHTHTHTHIWHKESDTTEQLTHTQTA